MPLNHSLPVLIGLVHDELLTKNLKMFSILLSSSSVFIKSVNMAAIEPYI
jgi:hypothetical protein